MVLYIEGESVVVDVVDGVFPLGTGQREELPLRLALLHGLL